jgi:hypothetical protein
MDKKNLYREKLLEDQLKKEAISKIEMIKTHIESKTPCVYGADYKQNLTIVIQDLEDILLNWEE